MRPAFEIRTIRDGWATTGAAILLTVFLGASPVAAFGDLINFGASLTDHGNTQLLAVSNSFPDPTPASLGYLDGRFTNGINAADVLNQSIEGTNTLGSIFGGDNYAFGGARAQENFDLIPDLSTQIDLYSATLGASPIPSDTLIMMSIGGNDVRDITIGGLTGAARQAVIDNAVSAITVSILTLQGLGAQNILFVGIGDVGSIPEILSLDGSFSTEGLLASQDLNAAIQTALPAGVQFFDTIGFFDLVALDPLAFGLPAGLNTTDSCLGSGGPAPGGAPTCDDFFFFDEIHPTSKVLQVLGDGLVAAIVPEPNTTLLLMLGLAGLCRRRSQPHSR